MPTITHVESFRDWLRERIKLRSEEISRSQAGSDARMMLKTERAEAEVILRKFNEIFRDSIWSDVPPIVQ